MMTRTEKDILATLRRLLADRLRVVELILFGSRSRGDSTPDSDMDVAVIIDGENNSTTRRAVEDCAWEAGFDAGIIVSPVVVSVEEWNDETMSESLLFRAVRAEGIVV